MHISTRRYRLRSEGGGAGRRGGEKGDGEGVQGGRKGRETHATSSPKSRIFLWQVSSRERREEEALLELPAPLPAPPWCTGVGGAETVVAEDATAAAAAADTDAEADGSRRTVTAPRAGERSIVNDVVVFVVAIVVVEDDLLGAPPSCPRIRSRTLGRHQILFVCHRTVVRLPPGIPLQADGDLRYRGRRESPRTLNNFFPIEDEECMCVCMCVCRGIYRRSSFPVFGAPCSANGKCLRIDRVRLEFDFF